MSGLRAASALGRLWHAEGRSEAVAGMLGPVLATFTEGFATADLIEARALMGKVAPGRPTAS